MSCENFGEYYNNDLLISVDYKLYAGIMTNYVCVKIDLNNVLKCLVSASSTLLPPPKWNPEILYKHKSPNFTIV